MIDLSIRPWTLFNDSLIPPPEPIQVEPVSEALLTRKNWPYWLLEDEDGNSYGMVLKNIETVEVSGSELKVNHDNGTE